MTDATGATAATPPRRDGPGHGHGDPDLTGGTAAETGQPGLKRVIGPRLLLLFVIGDILGTGVYALTGTVAGEVGGALWVPFLVAFCVALLTASSYVELVGKYPRAAGAALYTNKAFRLPFLTFLVAFAVMCSGITSASAAARAFGGTYLSTLLDRYEIPVPPTVVVAVVFIVALAALNYRGVQESVRTNVVLTLVELSGLVIVIVIGILALTQGEGNVGRVTTFDVDGNVIFGITAGAALAFFALVGFEDSVNMAEETRDPQRTFPRALFLGLAITGTIYLAVALASSLLVPTDVLAESTGPLLEVVRAGAPNFPILLFSAIALFAVTNSALINMMMASRLVYGMANERIVPRPLGRVHPVRRTPWVAILLTSGIAVLLVSTYDVSKLGGTTSLLLLCVFTVVNIAVLVLRKDRVEHDHFRAPTWMPVLGALTCAFLASPLSGRDLSTYWLALVLLAIGVALWAVNWAATRHTEGAPPRAS